MAKEQPNVSDLLGLLESTDLHELEQIKISLQEHLSSDRGSLLPNGLVDYYLETGSRQAIDILSSIREPHDKHLLDKMNDCMAKQGCRLPTLTLLGHVIRKQPPWIHNIARFPLLASLLKCLKTDSDVVVLVTGVLVLITLLPMIPQTGKPLLFEFFDIFGRLAAWNQRNPGHVQGVYVIHLHASVYSLFHRLYGMYPCNFVSYLRAHYSMKENMDTFEAVVKPMLEHVRIHPELVTGNQDYELDPTRWKRFETHDIVIECAKVSLDPKEASCEEGYSTMPDHVPRRHLDCAGGPYADLSSYASASSTPAGAVRPPRSLSFPHSASPASLCSPHTSCRQNREFNSSGIKDGIWSPSLMCGMSTPPKSPTNVSELAQSAPLLAKSHSTPVDGKSTLSANTPAGSSPLPPLFEEFEPTTPANLPSKAGPVAELHEPSQAKQARSKEPDGASSEDVRYRGGAGDRVKPMTLTELSDFVKEQELRPEKEREEDAITEELLNLTESRLGTLAMPGLHSSFSSTTETLTGNQEALYPPSDSNLHSPPHNLASTPDKAETTAGGPEQHPPWSLWPCFTPIGNTLCGVRSRSPYASEEPGLARYGLSPSDPAKDYEPLFDLALPRVASLFVERKTSEALQRAGREREQEGEEGDELSTSSPLEVLDLLIQQGNDSHYKELKRSPLPSKSADPHSGGKQQSMKGKAGPSAPLDELHMLRSQLLLLHNQLLYERYKREQHAIRNRRLLRSIINATALEEQNNSLKAQLCLQGMEIQALQASLQEEHRCSRHLREDGEAVVTGLQSQVCQLQQGRDEYYTKTQQLQCDLQESQKKMREMEAELQRANNKVCNTGHQLSQLSIKLTSSETLEQQLAFLNKQLLLLGEANKLCVEEIQCLGPEAGQELRMLQASALKEVERQRQSVVGLSQRLEASQQHGADLEAQLSKKEHLILEQKKFLEDVKGQARGQLQASENRYLAQKHVTQVLQSELLQLYSQLEIHSLTVNSGAADAAIEPRSNGSSSNTDLTAPAQANTQDKMDGSSFLCVNGAPGSPPSTTAAIFNGSQEADPALLESSLSPLACSSASLSPDCPLSAGSYPSAKSFLGMRARELFRNKSESQYEDDLPPLTGLSQGLATEACAEPAEVAQSGLGPTPASPASQAPSDTPPARATERHRARAYNVQRRRQDLRIMDYNELHHEQS